MNNIAKSEMDAKSQAPQDLTITPRQFDFNFLDALQKNPYWHGNDPVVTHFFNALQATFPEGERFFIDSARDARDEYGEHRLPAQLNEQIQMFIRQEAQHGQAHDQWTQALITTGYSKLQSYDRELRNLRLWSRKHISAQVRLSITAASEHFTASIAQLFLYKRPDLLERASPPFQSLLALHALEEVEHKSVCYDLYQQVSGNYGLRIVGLIGASVDIMFRVAQRQIYLLKKDKQWTLRNKLKAWQLIWGRKGIARLLIPFALNYLRPNFHPWETDERALIQTRFGHLF